MPTRPGRSNASRRLLRDLRSAAAGGHVSRHYESIQGRAPAVAVWIASSLRSCNDEHRIATDLCRKTLICSSAPKNPWLAPINLHSIDCNVLPEEQAWGVVTMTTINARDASFGTSSPGRVAAGIRRSLGADLSEQADYLIVGFAAADRVTPRAAPRPKP